MRLKGVLGATVASGLFLAVLYPVAGRAQNLVQDGHFTQLTLNESAEFGSLYPQQQVGGWATSGYNLVFLPNTATTSGATTSYGTLQLWGPGDGANNGFVDAPGGGNFIAADGAFDVAPVTQSLTGLTVGDTIAVSFDWAAAQQYTYSGATTENWVVGLGSQSYTTPTYNNPQHGFSGWMNASYDFVATSSTETLSFLSQGTPNGQPPFSLLADVSATDIAHPAPLPMLAGTPLGMLAVAAAMRRFRRKKVV